MFAYEIIDHGVEHDQYFQGAGVAFTNYTEIVTGAGSSAREAGEDALEMFWQNVIKTDLSVADAERLEAEIAKLSEEYDAHTTCYEEWMRTAKPEHTIAMFEKWHESCELSHRVSIRWGY